ncbi:cytochrome P450 [Gordonia sp. TBRC 11910]|uniref:Cytochrome P450 n=1 Tax=Gordonia asplenii TaxID=2725283 RepID=A0A848KVR6_9ACTN|nr:cytochrome P450 [Gordonia asplenii]NMO00281.1 cytochrome P450 [Gordonia asplenii]
MATPELVREPPTLRTNWLLGTLVGTLRDPLGMMTNAYAECGSAMRSRMGPPGIGVDLVSFFDPDAVAHIVDNPTYQTYRKDSRFYQQFSELLGDGLLTAQGETWKRQRRIIQPVFTARVVDSYASVMNVEAQSVVDGWRRSGVAEIDVGDEMMAATLRIIARLFFGEDAEEMIGVVRSSFPILGRAALTRGALPTAPPLRWPLPGNRRIVAARQDLFGLCDRIIARRRRAADPGDDLIGRLIAARDDHGDALSDIEIRDQLMIFLLAGHETTSTALTFALWLLGHHDTEQQQVRDEVGRLDSNPSASDFQQLAFTTMVLKEAMRLYPSAPILNRIAARDDVIDGYRVRRGQMVLFSPWVMHRRADLWPDPLKFDPLRFTPENEATRHRLAWMPFAHGPRGCIGQRFAMLESAVVLANVIAAFQIRSDTTELSLGSDLTLQLREPIHCALIPLEK